MARRPWLYTERGENQIGGFVKEFTNIVFLTIKVGLGWGCWPRRIPVLWSEGCGAAAAGAGGAWGLRQLHGYLFPTGSRAHGAHGPAARRLHHVQPLH